MNINLSKIDNEIAEMRKMQNDGERLSWAVDIMNQIILANAELDARISEVRVEAGLSGKGV